MLSGIHLSLMIGVGVPTPAPAVVLESLTGVKVNASKNRTGFQLTFTVGKTSPLLTTMLPAGYFDPIITRVIIVVTLKGTPYVLSDGVITRQELSASSQPGESTLTVTGEDLSVLMDLVEMPFMRYPAMPEIARIYLILAKYLVLGIVPVAIPPLYTFVPIPTREIPTQTGTDLEYLQLLARRNGYVFYVEAGPAPGMNIAYWGPDIRIPNVQSALSVNLDAGTNVDSLSFSLDGTAKKVIVLTIFDSVTQKIPIPIPIPNINILHPPLGARPTVPARVEFPEGMAGLSPQEVLGRALGILMTSADAISVSGTLDVLRYGRTLKARQLVGVRGAGLAYDGLYYVNSVTHDIKQGEYKQSFTLSRDGLIAAQAQVVP